MNTLKINGELIDIGAAVISTKIQKIEIGDLTGRFLDYTGDINLPATEVNLQRLGFPTSEHSTSDKPYRILDAEFTDESIQLMKEAKVIIKRSDDKIKINVFENLIDYFSAVKGIKVKDINPIADSGWTASDIDAARTNTSGIISALINWGKSDIQVYDSDFFLPSFYYHTIMTAILEYTGLTLSGNILTDSRFTDLVIPYPGETFLYPEEFINPFNGRATNTGHSFGGVTNGVYYIIQLDIANYGADNFDLSNDKYELNSSVPLTATINGHCEVSNVIFNTGTTLYLKLIRLRGVTETELDSVTIYPGDGNENVSYTGGIETGDKYYIVLHSDAAMSPGVSGDIDTAYIEVIPSTTINRDLVAWRVLWPDISCDDLIKDFMTRFSIIPKMENGVLYLKSIQEIITDRANTIDWSSKLVKTGSNIDFSNKYAAENYFYYSDSDDTMQPLLGRGSISIDSEVIDPVKDIYTSTFGNSLLFLSLNFDNYRIAWIKIYDSTSTGIDDFKMEPGLRLLTLKSVTNEATVSFDATPRSDYKLAYFVDSTQTKDTGWQYFIDQFYQGLSQALQKIKVPLKFFNLDAMDIKNYDPHKNIWDGYSYSLLNSMEYISKKITKASLFRIV